MRYPSIKIMMAKAAVARDSKRSRALQVNHVHVHTRHDEAAGTTAGKTHNSGPTWLQQSVPRSRTFDSSRASGAVHGATRLALAQHISRGDDELSDRYGIDQGLGAQAMAECARRGI